MTSILPASSTPGGQGACRTRRSDYLLRGQSRPPRGGRDDQCLNAVPRIVASP